MNLAGHRKDLIAEAFGPRLPEALGQRAAPQDRRG
jgi:hypothetical protein